MSYKARRKQEVQARAEKTKHVMVDYQHPTPVKRHAPNEPLPDRVPIRINNHTVRDLRVSKLERDLDFYAKEFDMSVPELRDLIATRRYTPAPAPKAVEPRAPSWYVSDMYQVPGTDIF